MSNQLITGFVHDFFLRHLKPLKCVNFSELFLYRVFRAPCQVVHKRALGCGSQESSDKVSIPHTKEKS